MRFLACRASLSMGRCSGGLFRGADASAIMLDYLSNPTLFQSTEMCRISDMPMGIERK